MSDEIPELPDWVKTLVNAAKDDAYWNGYYEGRRHLWEEFKKKVASWDPR